MYQKYFIKKENKLWQDQEKLHVFIMYVRGNCDLGKEGTFRKHCQTCKTYKKKPGGKPARTDNRRQKMERIMKKEQY